jgi:hypothetical protein
MRENVADFGARDTGLRTARATAEANAADVLEQMKKQALGHNEREQR